MCGIAGIIGRPTEERRAAVARMVAALEHRGPDGRGIAEFSNCLLGHTRLSIVDIDGGAQPMTYDRGSTQVAVTFNGEIYGYKSLRTQFSGFPFKTASDTEVLLAAYESQGLEFIESLPGMFSFALWDDERQRLFCARDRFGEKPFYYAYGKSGEFIFASEVSAIVASQLVNLTMNSSSLAGYLRHLYVPVDASIYTEICALPPGHALLLEDGTTTVSRYWKTKAVDDRITLGEATSVFRELLEAAVEKQLVADVPVGVFLSGGLDSTTIAYLASRKHKGIHSYSFDFPGSLSEREFATSAAQRYGTSHTVMSAESFDIAELLPEILAIYGEPFGDTSAVPTYLLCKRTAEHTKVALTGDGGDELLGGYRWYQNLYWMSEHADSSWITRILLRIRSRALRELRLPGAERAEEKNVGAILSQKFESVIDAHLRQICFFDDTELSDLGLSAPTECFPASYGTLDDALRYDVANYMPGDILTKIDRASMAHGLELRAPFLDVDVASFCLSLPSDLKIDEQTDKLILRQAFSSDWPASIRSRQKQGFGGPVNDWLAQPAMQDLLSSAVFDRHARINDHIDLGRLRQRADRLEGMQMWAILCLGIWLETVSGL